MAFTYDYKREQIIMLIFLNQHSFISGSELDSERDSGSLLDKLSFQAPIIHILAGLKKKA